MKIVLVHNSYQQPGGEDVVFEQERTLLEEHGHQVSVYQRSNFEADSYAGLKRLALIRNTIWSDPSRRDFAELLSSVRPDLVHVHNTFMMISPSIYSAAREAGIPVVQTLHNYRLLCPAANFLREGRVCEECTQHSLWRSVRYGCYRDSRTATATVALMLATHRRLHTWERNVISFIALSEFSRSRFVENGFPAERVVVKSNFVHPDPGARKDDGEYAVFAGRLSPEKGIYTLLNAWKLLPRTIPLVVIGDSPEREALQQQAREAGLSHVVFHGQLSRPQTLETMRRARFLVQASELYENFSVVIAESFACGLPVLCSRLGAMQEIVKDRRTGLHFNPGDAADLAEKVTWAWNNRDFMAELGRGARREYESKYTGEKNYPVLMNIYQKAIQANASQRALHEMTVPPRHDRSGQDVTPLAGSSLESK